MNEKKYLIAIPCMDSIPTPTVYSLINLKKVSAVKHSFLANSLVYDARNMLAAEALDTGADRILFIDSDMYFSPDMMERMADDMDNGAKFVSGIYFKRRPPIEPCIYKAIDPVGSNGEIYRDYPKDSLFRIAGCGFGAVMLDVDLLRDVADHSVRPFAPINGMLGEDLSFCYRATQLGYELWCDSRIKIGHIGQFIFSEEHYKA